MSLQYTVQCGSNRVEHISKRLTDYGRILKPFLKITSAFTAAFDLRRSNLHARHWLCTELKSFLNNRTCDVLGHCAA